MNRFHKLVNNESDFPILDNVDVYQFDNEFDYQRYNSIQMELQICTVPWDVGEAHVGQRTISGIGNVVWFETKEKRNAWFDAIPDDKCYRFATKYKELHRDMTIDVPIPFDMCARHNYLVVRYNLFANEHSPVEHEGIDGLRDWFWFIREVEFIAANTTRLHLLDDAFQTWIYDINVSGMVLERGHAPMFATTADQYLANPLENNTYLLTDDVNYGQPSQVKHIDELVLNDGTMYACIATTANPNTSWGSKSGNDWHTPASASYTQNGVPSTFVFAVAVSDLNSLLSNITANYPQFKQTVQGIFFVSDELITLSSSFSFASTTCYTVSSTRQTFNLSQLQKSQFGYDAKYENIAKLYTYPYAHIEITDENGQVDIVKVEDTSGILNVSAALSLAYPFITLDTHLLGVGGNASASITFRNISARTFNIGGKWYDTLKSWNIPTFAVVLDPAREYDYSTHFDRAQRVVDYETAYENTKASADTTKTNSDARVTTTRDNTKLTATANRDNTKNLATATRDNTYDAADTTRDNVKVMSQAQKSNSDASADTLVSNIAIQTAANTAITSRSNQSALSDASLSNSLSQALQAWEAGFTRATAIAEAETATESAAVGAAGGALNSAVSGAVGGAGAGIPGVVAGAIGGLVSGAIGGATSMAQTAMSANLLSTKAELTVGVSQSKVNETSRNNTDRTTNQNSANSDNVATSNSVSTGTAANSAATEKSNASRTQTATNTTADSTNTTDRGNATRTKEAADAAADNTFTAETTAADNTYKTETESNTRDYDTTIANADRTKLQAQKAIENDIAQAALRSPFVYGAFNNGESATTKPIALFANIVTQSKSAISSAGDEFLRYGYMFDKQWSFDGNWNVGKYFTYWKLRDFWVYALNVPDMYMDKIRFFLFGGVTVWRRPEDIGRVTVYDNFG